MKFLNEIVGTSRIWKEEIESFIQYNRLQPAQVPEAIFKWFTKVLQLVRKCLTEQQFNLVLEISHPQIELSHSIHETSLLSVEKSLLSTQRRLDSLSKSLLGVDAHLS